MKILFMPIMSHFKELLSGARIQRINICSVIEPNRIARGSHVLIP